MWIYVKDDMSNYWRIDFDLVRKDLEKTLTTVSPVKSVHLTEDDVLQFLLDNPTAFTAWQLVEQADPDFPVSIRFAIVIMNEDEAMPQECS